MAACALHPGLRTRVASIDVFENDGGESVVLPSTSAVLGFQFRGRVRAGADRLSLAGVTGLQCSSRTYSYEERTGSVLVRFSPQGAACLGIPPEEITGQSAPLDELLPQARVARAIEAIHLAPDNATRVALVEELLLELPFARDPLVTRALTRIEDSAVSVAGLAKELGVSERQLERRFVARVGLTPKRFARLARFERAMTLMRSAPALSDAALRAGYYDQSHFIRDVREFSGVTPAALLRR